MGFFFRKRFRLCKGINLNLSKNGVGVSVGVKGFRISRNANGQTYLNCGRNGLYYRKRLDKAPKNNDDDVEMDKTSKILVISLIALIIISYIGAFIVCDFLKFGILKTAFYAIVSSFVIPASLVLIVFVGWLFLIFVLSIIAAFIGNDEEENNSNP